MRYDLADFEWSVIQPFFRINRAAWHGLTIVAC
jgi:hypothetical protein